MDQVNLELELTRALIDQDWSRIETVISVLRKENEEREKRVKKAIKKQRTTLSG